MLARVLGATALTALCMIATTATPPAARQAGGVSVSSVILQASVVGEVTISFSGANPGAPVPTVKCRMDVDAQLYPGESADRPRYWLYYAAGRCTMPMVEIGYGAALWSPNSGARGEIGGSFGGTVAYGERGRIDCPGNGLCLGIWHFKADVDFEAPPGVAFIEADGACRPLHGGTILFCSLQKSITVDR